MIREAATKFMDAVKAEFVVTLAQYPRVYGPGRRPPIPSSDAERRAFFPYVACYPSRRYASDTRRLSDESSVYGFRVVTMCVGRTDSEVEYAQEKVIEAVEGKRLVIAGYSSTPIHYETSTVIEQDSDVEDLFTSSIEWTWVSTKQLAA